MDKERGGYMPPKQEVQGILPDTGNVYSIEAENTALADNPASPLSDTQLVKKTGKMKLAERKFGEPLDVVLRKLHLDEGKTLTEVANELGVSSASIRLWMEGFGIERKTKSIGEMWKNPAFRERQKAIHKAAWADPQKKAARVTKIHNPESDAKRQESRKKYFRDHPEVVRSLIQRAQEGRIRKRKERMSNLFGENPTEELARLAKDLKPSEIAAKYGVPTTLIVSWLNAEKIAPLKKKVVSNLRKDKYEERQSIVRRAIESGSFDLLSDQHSEVLKALYVDSSIHPGIKAIAEKKGLTRQRIQQLEKKGLSRLQQLLEGNSDIRQKRKRSGPAKRFDEKKKIAQEAKDLGLLEKLTFNQQEVLRVRYLETDSNIPLSKLSEKLGMSAPAICNIEKGALGKINRILERRSKVLSPYTPEEAAQFHEIVEFNEISTINPDEQVVQVSSPPEEPKEPQTIAEEKITAKGYLEGEITTETLDDIEEASEHMIAIAKYLSKGEVVSPYIPITEFREVDNQRREAIERFSKLCMSLLTDERISSILLRSEYDPLKAEQVVYSTYGQSRGGYNTTSGVYLKRGTANEFTLIIRQTQKRGIYGTEEAAIQDVRKEISERFPTNIDKWNFECVNRRTSIKGEYYDKTIIAFKELDASDLPDNIYFFSRFVRGSKKMFEKAHEYINKKTTTEEGLEEIRRLIAACAQASDIVEQVISS